MDSNPLCDHFKAQLSSSKEPYEQLNALRDWVNSHLSDFELYLEDVWNDRVVGETHFEYILRSKKTYQETPVLGYDVYQNHRDAKGVWHLDDYSHSVCLIEDPMTLVVFVEENG